VVIGTERLLLHNAKMYIYNHFRSVDEYSNIATQDQRSTRLLLYNIKMYISGHFKSVNTNIRHIWDNEKQGNLLTYLSIEVSQKLLYTCLIFNLEISNEMNYPRSRQTGQEV
jgi:hypothetical protein